MGSDDVGSHRDRDEVGRCQGIRVDRVSGRVGHRDPAVHRDVGIAAQDNPVGELGDGDPRSVVVEGGDLSREPAVRVVPRGGAPVVDAEPFVVEVPVRTVLDQEGAAETRDDAVEVPLPPDG